MTVVLPMQNSMPNPVCPLAHSDPTIVRNGVQRTAGRDRQRWRCTPQVGDAHFFVGPLAHTQQVGGHCVECEREVAVHEGPTAPGGHGFLVREIAAGLVGLGKGETYTAVAQRARNLAVDRQRSYSRGAGTVVNGQLVADWLARFGPVVAASHAETAWPEVLVLDSTEFMHTDSWTGHRFQLFTVLAAFGYPADGSPGRLWRLQAAPHDDGEAWRSFLAALPGRPGSIVVDEDKAIRAGVALHWPNRRPAIHRCEHHLYVNARQAMAADDVPDDRELHELLNDAFHSPVQWDAFATEVRANNGRRALGKWVNAWEPKLRCQLARRAAHPVDRIGVWANGAIEDPIRVARQVLERRAWTFRNLARMNLLLELVRLRINAHDDTHAYAAAIRKHLAKNGVPEAPAIADHATSSLRA